MLKDSRTESNGFSKLVIGFPRTEVAARHYYSKTVAHIDAAYSGLKNHITSP